ncbi:MAG: hypothetical protein JRC86_13160, partial [Deltaproteobacteria bacterium]|nr:hypothetical protein [Deltaproteobacteria bacterium]
MENDKGKTEKSPSEKKVEELRRTLKPAQLAFVEHYVKGATPSEAHCLAGLSDSTDTNKRQANTLLKAPRIRAY